VNGRSVSRRRMRGATSLVRSASVGSQRRPPTPASLTQCYACQSWVTSDERRKFDFFGCDRALLRDGLDQCSYETSYETVRETWNPSRLLLLEQLVAALLVLGGADDAGIAQINEGGH
jgi:hypothetical protein